MNVFLLLFAIVALGIILAYWFPEQTKRWTQNIVFARKVLFAAGALIMGFVLIGTGLWYLVAIGGFTYLVAVWIGYFQFYKGEQVT